MKIETAKELDVYKAGFQLAMEIFDLTKTFPSEEKYALTSQIRRSSRSICLNLREAWAKRRYESAFREQDHRLRRREQRSRFGPGFRKRLWLHLSQRTQTSGSAMRRDRSDAERH